MNDFLKKDTRHYAFIHVCVCILHLDWGELISFSQVMTNSACPTTPSTEITEKLHVTIAVNKITQINCQNIKIKSHSKFPFGKSLFL